MKKMLSFVLIISFILVVLPLAADIVVADFSFAGGDGSAETPYQVSTPEQLDNVRNHLNAHFIQINDIDMTAATAQGGVFYNNEAGWKPIGDAITGQTDSMFTGTYDGGGNKIIGLKIDYKSPTYVYVGLFGHVYGGTIKNLVMEGGRFSGESNGSTHYNVFVGSIAGWISDGTITNCHSTSDVFATSDAICSAGGIVGNGSAWDGSGSIITNCYSTGRVSSSAPGSSPAGGIVGGFGRGIIANCYNTGEISVTTNYGFAGGNAGGIVGEASLAIISGSYNAGNISSNALACLSSAGGIAGLNRSVIRNCYNTGAIYSNSTISSSSAGGITGYNNWSSVSDDNGPIENGVINNCYNTGEISAFGNYTMAGGVVGINDDATITNCFWNADVLSVGIGAIWNESAITNVLAKTSSEMKNQSNFTSFDFYKTWGISSDINSGYPYLQALHITEIKIESYDGTNVIISSHIAVPSAIIIIAGYDGNKITSLKQQLFSLVKGVNSISLTFGQTQNIKIFLWQDLSGMRPLKKYTF